MPVQLDISELISTFGAPATAVVLAVGIVRGARALEKDANPQALKYVARLLADRNFASFGKLAPTLVPFIFDRVFGSNYLSWKFIRRSILATTIFWISLGFAKNLGWSAIKADLQNAGDTYLFMVPIFYLFDWISLMKARFILRILGESRASCAALAFLVIDVICSYALAYFAIFIFGLTYWLYSLHELISRQEFEILLDSFMHLGALVHYLDISEKSFNPRGVAVPSTMLTSIWTFLLIISGMIAQLLIPLDYLRRFTAWWFRDIENYPLTAIAKVGAALILIGSMLIKVLRWI